MLRLLAERELPVARIAPLASSRAADRTVPYAGAELAVRAVSQAALAEADLVLASAGGAVSREWLPFAAEQGAVCVDNTSAFRMDDDVPLVVPEVNADRLDGIELGGGPGAIVANPNCSTIQLVVALEPLRRAFGLERVVVSTYQSVSGAGRAALERFRAATAAGDDAPALPGVPAFDVLPAIGEPERDGHTTEEWKMIRETPKILGADVPVDATCVRVPVVTGHAEAVLVETREPVTVADAERVLRAAPGVRLHADAGPTPRALAGSREVHVGRLRPARTGRHGLHLWVVADNLLKGAAWNAVQIVEALVARSVPA
jgi:aspartate-semialdehyde dehydrogenase